MPAVLPQCRSFTCGICGKLSTTCSSCDRNRRYCGPGCAGEARRRSVRASQARYRKSEAGRAGNARRQRDHYHRQREPRNLTHQSSEGTGSLAIIPPLSGVAGDAQEIAYAEIVAMEAHAERSPPADARQTSIWPPEPSRAGLRCCDFCGRLCEVYPEDKERFP